MLGSEKLTVRLRGICALAWLAREDVQAVMTAVGMRTSSQIETEKKEKYWLDFFGANLEGLYLSSANLTRVRLGWGESVQGEPAQHKSIRSGSRRGESIRSASKQD